MSWLDNVIGFISPERAYKREAWRQSTEAMRNYDAGNFNKTNQNWRAVNDSGEVTDNGSRDIVRARARDLERNSDMMNSIIGAYKRNVIGSAYNLQARTPDATLNKQIEKYWRIWCKKNNCDVTGTQSLNQMMRMAIERKKVDGGILFYKAYTKDGLVPFKLQCLEVDELDGSSVMPKYAKDKIIGGIELNSFNKIIGYWIKQYSNDGFSMQSPIFVEAKDMIYYFAKKRPSQIREMSDMSPTITRIRDANEFMNAVSIKERINACLAIFIKKQIPDTGIGRAYDPGAGSSQFNYNGKTLSPGLIQQLNAGDEIQVVNPNGQATDATTYIKLQQRLVGAGQGISYEATARDMSETNYSSARQALIEDELTYADEKELLLDVFDEVYETFVISGVLSGLFQTANFWNEKNEYLSHEWIQTPKRWIDPLKESNANKTALNTLQKTFKEIAAENGKDWQEQIDDIVDVIEYGRLRNLELGGMLFGLPQENGSEKDGTADDETDEDE